MSHTTTIITSAGIIHHHNAIATEPGFCVQIMIVQPEGDRLSWMHETINFLDIKISWLK